MTIRGKTNTLCNVIGLQCTRRRAGCTLCAHKCSKRAQLCRNIFFVPSDAGDVPYNNIIYNETLNENFYKPHKWCNCNKLLYTTTTTTTYVRIRPRITLVADAAHISRKSSLTFIYKIFRCTQLAGARISKCTSSRPFSHLFEIL